ncbi:MAG: hypothetical protein FWC24_01125, partial [Treponema sp.]|nr:hypothetical protein [Treponema sp.]
MGSIFSLAVSSACCTAVRVSLIRQVLGEKKDRYAFSGLLILKVPGVVMMICEKRGSRMSA